MTDWKALQRIGSELDDLEKSGQFTFADFKRLYLEAEAVAGTERDVLEMFSPAAKDPEWRSWIGKHTSSGKIQRVA